MLGHEIIGQVVTIGPSVKGIEVGQKVGIGWTAKSCMHCRQCMSGNHNFCPESVQTIIGHSGGFASRVRVHWAWTLPLPEKLPLAEAGPLLCAGVTVFNPLDTYTKPQDRVGIVGIGGLGHLAVQFSAAFGCEVTAFTSNENKFQEAQGFGAQHVVSSRDSSAIKKLKGTLDFLLVTVNVPLDWPALISTLAPKGRIHFVGVVTEPIPITVFPLLVNQLSISSSPIGPPVAIASICPGLNDRKVVCIALIPTTLRSFKATHFHTSQIAES